MESFDTLSHDDGQGHTPLDYNVDDVLPSQPYESPFASSPPADFAPPPPSEDFAPPPPSADFASPFETDINVNNNYNDSDRDDNLFVSHEPVLPPPDEMMPEPMLPPPNEMMPEEGFALREWRRLVSFYTLQSWFVIAC